MAAQSLAELIQRIDYMMIRPAGDPSDSLEGTGLTVAVAESDADSDVL
jgi:hypothetical protein